MMASSKVQHRGGKIATHLDLWAGPTLKEVIHLKKMSLIESECPMSEV